MHTCWYVAGALVFVALLSTALPRRGERPIETAPARSDGDSPEIATTLA